MLQGFRLDRRIAPVYLALGLAGCRSGAPALVPADIQTVDSDKVTGWVNSSTPDQSALHRFQWLYVDEQASKGGRGSARIAVPDTLRFDFAGSLGIGKGSALVIGDSARWVVPERSVEDLVPSFPLLWALLGVAMEPKQGARLAGLEENGKIAWRYADGADTVEYLRQNGDPITFSAEVRHGGKVTGRTRMTMRADGTPIKAQLNVPSVPAKLEITFYATVPTPVFPLETWARPEP